MTDLSKGIIELEGIVLSRNTKASDFVELSNPNIKVTISKRGHTYVKFLKPLTANGVEMYVEVNCYKDSDTPEIVLFPNIPTELVGKFDEIAKYKIEASKKWLKSMVEATPTTDCEIGTSYHLIDVHITSFIRED